MDVELLVVPDCPHEKSAALLLRSALDDIGLTAVNVELTVIATEEDAQRRGFVGSPTIMLNGIDPFRDALSADVGFLPHLSRHRRSARPTGAAESTQTRRVRYRATMTEASADDVIQRGG